MELPLIDPKFGYVEDVLEEHFYKNADYRDTIIPLWHTLYKSSHNLYPHDKRGDIFSGFFKGKENKPEEQLQINLALCASIIQLGKQLTNNKYNNNTIFFELSKINDEIDTLHIEINSIKKQIKKLTN